MVSGGALWTLRSSLWMVKPMRRNAAGSVGIKENVCIREMHGIYLFIYCIFSLFNSNKLLSMRVLPSLRNIYKEPMELTVIGNFHHTEGISRGIELGTFRS